MHFGLLKIVIFWFGGGGGSKMQNEWCVRIPARGPGEASQCRKTIFTGQLPRNYPPAGAILKDEKSPSLIGGEAIGEAF